MAIEMKGDFKKFALLIFAFALALNACVAKVSMNVEEEKAAKVEALVSNLEDKDPEKRLLAAKGLRDLRDRLAVNPLVKVLGDDNEGVQNAAIEALARQGTPAVEPLIKAMAHEKAIIRRNAIKAITALVTKKIGFKGFYEAGGVEALLKALNDNDAQVRAFSATVLGLTDDNRVVEPLIKALEDKEVAVKRNAVLALKGLEDLRVAEPAIKALVDKDAFVREGAAGLLGGLRHRGAVEPLVRALNDEAPGVRGEAASALGKIGDASSSGPLIKAFADKESSVRKAAIEALVNLGEAARGPLVRAMDDRNPDVTTGAAQALGRILGIGEDELKGRIAEEKGRFREALKHYMTALANAEAFGDTDKRVREGIIRLAKGLDPPPTVPEEAHRRSARGTAAIELARSKGDFEDSAQEFLSAANIAPWWAEAYFNLGVALEKAQSYEKAKRAFGLYLTAAPDAPDVKDVQTRLYKLEYAMEHGKKEEERKKRELEKYDYLEGIWKNKESGNPYAVTISGNLFEAKRERWLIRGVIKDSTIEGTWKQYKYSTKHKYAGKIYTCWWPEQESAATGTISPDGRSIAFRYKEKDYEATLKGATEVCEVTEKSVDWKMLILERKEVSDRSKALPGASSSGWLGISIQELTPELARKLGLHDAKGVSVNGVENGGPAEAAGIKAGDIIIEFNGKEVGKTDELPKLVAGTKPGEKATIVILRENRKVSLSVTMGRSPSGLKKVDLAKIPLSDAVVMGNPMADKKVIVFDDVDCPYCKKLHEEIKKILEQRKDIAFYIKLFPLEIHPEAYEKSKAIICNKKSVKLLDDAFAGKKLPKPDCEAKEIDENIKLGKSLGITGTPTIIFPDGRLLPGYLEAPRLIELIEKPQ